MEKVILICGEKSVSQNIEKIKEKGFYPISFCLLNEEHPLQELENDMIRSKLLQIKEENQFLRVVVLFSEPMVYDVIGKLIELEIFKKSQFVNNVREKYWSCDYLENGITICGDGVKNCCGNDYEEFSVLPKLSLDKQLIENTDTFLERFFSLKQKIIMQNKSGGKTNCVNCPYLRYDYWPEEKIIKILNFSLDHSCNLKCEYCYKQQSGYVRPSVQPDITEIIRALLNSKYVKVGVPIYYSCGEICIQPNADEIIDLLKPFEVTFYTNATKYNAKLHEIIKKPKSCAIISLDAGTSDTYKMIKGKDLFDAVCDNIRRYSSNDGHVILKFIINEKNSNKEDINGFIKICKYLKIKNIRISRDWRNGGIEDTDIDIKSASARLYYKAKKNSINCFMDGVSVCGEW